ncbi:MAG: pilus assembly PilX N-terminal domain-containing protein [Deinococcota bacterium]
MTVRTVRLRKRRQQEGIALVVVLLLTAIILTIVVSTTATLALGARGGGVNERTSYQALLAAESGLNTFAVRVNQYAQSHPYTGSSADDLSTWLTAFSTYTLGSFGTATLTFQNVSVSPSGATFTVSSQGAASGATKNVLQDYKLSPGRLPLQFRSRAALTSLPPINANGSASIQGQANDGVITQVKGTSITLPVRSNTVSLPVEDTTGVLVGDYVKVSGATFRVDAKDGGSLSLTRVSPALTSPLPLSGGVTLMLNAVAASYNSIQDPSTLRVSNAGDFVVGEKINVANATGVIQSVDLVNKTVTIDWTSDIPAKLDEGTQILRDVTAMRSAEDISPKKNKLDGYSMTSGGVTRNDCSSPTVCVGARDPLLRRTDNTPFFTQDLLGLSDAELNDLVPVSRPPFTMKNEIRRISAQDFDSAIKNSNFSGVLIVDGDINSNVNGNTTFNGLIYFRGNQGGKFNGNLTVNGAIAVRGGPIEGITTNDDVATDITGNLTVNYNAVQLRQRIFNSTAVPHVEVSPQTWRQR